MAPSEPDEAGIRRPASTFGQLTRFYPGPSSGREDGKQNDTVLFRKIRRSEHGGTTRIVIQISAYDPETARNINDGVDGVIRIPPIIDGGKNCES